MCITIYNINNNGCLTRDRRHIINNSTISFILAFILRFLYLFDAFLPLLFTSKHSKTHHFSSIMTKKSNKTIALINFYSNNRVSLHSILVNIDSVYFKCLCY